MPDEGLWVLVVVLDEGADGVYEFPGGAVNAAPELLYAVDELLVAGRQDSGSQYTSSNNA